MDNTRNAPMVWPALRAHDAAALIDYLTGTLGFVETARHQDSDRVAHAELRWPEGGGVMLGDHRPDGGWSREPGTAGSYVVTNRIDEVYERARSGGAEVVQELQETDYGSREFAVRDPEGNLWSFGTYPGEPMTVDVQALGD
ncbi:MAG TPA: VOC family protein [Marmoricola sp.]|nr:VOC family protein [Marmoricola sp.]